MQVTNLVKAVYVVALTACWSGSAIAAEVLPSTDAPGFLSTSASPAPLPFSGSYSAVDVSKLGELRGGSDRVASDQKIGGAVADNVAMNVVSGSNSISAGAFANSSGIPIIIQNSGANVLIQNATIINLQLK